VLRHNPQIGSSVRTWAMVVAIARSLMLDKTASAQIETTEDWKLERVAKGDRWPSAQAWGKGGTLAASVIDPRRDRLVAVSDERESGRNVTRRTLRFYKREAANYVEDHRFTTHYQFVTMWSEPVGKRLFTTWASGSAYRTGVFAIEGAAVRLVMWIAWKSPLEFADVDGDGEPEIINGVDGHAGGPPERAIVYRWSGNDYVLMGVVPFTERFRSVR